MTTAEVSDTMTTAEVSATIAPSAMTASAMTPLRHNLLRHDPYRRLSPMIRYQRHKNCTVSVIARVFKARTPSAAYCGSEMRMEVIRMIHERKDRSAPLVIERFAIATSKI